MNKWKRMVLAFVSSILLMSTVGCWNYIEIEDMSIVAGVAIDKGPSDGKLLVTTEIVIRRKAPNQVRRALRCFLSRGRRCLILCEE
jgi:hypothetical protein